VAIKLQRREIFDAVFEAANRLRRRSGHRLHLQPTFNSALRLDELGVDSISIAEIVDEIEKRFKVELPFDELLLVESVEQFIDVICDSEAA